MHFHLVEMSCILLSNFPCVSKGSSLDDLISLLKLYEIVVYIDD